MERHTKYFSSESKWEWILLVKSMGSHESMEKLYREWIYGDWWNFIMMLISSPNTYRVNDLLVGPLLVGNLLVVRVIPGNSTPRRRTSFSSLNYLVLHLLLVDFLLVAHTHHRFSFKNSSSVNLLSRVLKPNLYWVCDLLGRSLPSVRYSTYLCTTNWHIVDVLFF